MYISYKQVYSRTAKKKYIYIYNYPQISSKSTKFRVLMKRILLKVV